eukprot:357286-Chlamydomonas_euryale.AAC.14
MEPGPHLSGPLGVGADGGRLAALGTLAADGMQAPGAEVTRAAGSAVDASAAAAAPEHMSVRQPVDGPGTPAATAAGGVPDSSQDAANADAAT